MANEVEQQTGTSQKRRAWLRSAGAYVVGAWALLAVLGLIERAREEDARVAAEHAWVPLRACLSRVDVGDLRCDAMGTLHGEWAHHGCVGCGVAASALRMALENPEMHSRPLAEVLAALARVHAAFQADTLPAREDVELLLRAGSQPVP